MCMQPYVLAAIYCAHTWNVFFFGFMMIWEESIIYFSLMIVFWLILEYFCYYVPLVRLRPKKASSPAR